MIKRFNDYDSINEKWGLEFIIPILIAFGVATESEAQTMSRKEIETIIEQNPEINIALENKKILKDTLKELEDIKNGINFLLENNSSDIEKIKRNLENSDLKNSIKDIIREKLDGSYLINIPKAGHLMVVDMKISDSFKLNYTKNPWLDTFNVGIKKTF